MKMPGIRSRTVASGNRDPENRSWRFPRNDDVRDPSVEGVENNAVQILQLFVAYGVPVRLHHKIGAVTVKKTLFIQRNDWRAGVS